MTDDQCANAIKWSSGICVRALLQFDLPLYLLLINPKSTIFVYVTIFLVAVLSIIMKIVYPLFTEVFEAYDTNNSIQENITNMRVVVGAKQMKQHPKGFTPDL